MYEVERLNDVYSKAKMPGRSFCVHFYQININTDYIMWYKIVHVLTVLLE